MTADLNNKFVAFSDISGFKVLMRKDKETALKVLRRFFKIGYDTTNPDTGNYKESIQGLFVSDCCIIWPLGSGNNPLDNFNLLLQGIQNINQAVLNDPVMKKQNVMLKTSIAYGEFQYIEVEKHALIQKELIFGDAYIRAYDDNSLKLDPGLCRIVIDEKFPKSIKRKIDKNEIFDGSASLIEKLQNKYYFFWNCQHKEDIAPFWNEYSKLEEERYKKMYTILSNGIE
jgi:hypothetical protein